MRSLAAVSASVVLSIAALATLLAPPVARACSCVPARLTREVMPSDGARGFPTDGTLRVFLTAFSPAARAALASEYRLRDAAGHDVPLVAQVVSTRLDLAPLGPLRPETEYTLEQVFAFDAQGTRVSDTDRRYARAGSLRGVWYPVSTFRTGRGPAARRGVVPGIARSTLGFSHGGGDCGPAASVMVELQVPPHATDTDVVELRVQGQGVVATAPAVGLGRLHAGDTLCDPDPVRLAGGASISVQIAILDATRGEVGASPWVVVTGTGARPTGSAGTGRGRDAALPTLAIEAAPAARASGPAACPHGLEVLTRTEVAATGAPWAYGDRATIASDGARGWLAFASAGEAPAPPRLVTVDGTGRLATPRASVRGWPQALVPGAVGPLAVLVEPSSPSTLAAQLVAFDGSGGAAWRAPLAGRGGSYRLARGGGHVLAMWSASNPDYSQQVALSLHDERTGAVLASALPTAEGIDTNAEGGVAAHVDGRFLIVWPSGMGMSARTGLRSAVLAPGTVTMGPASALALDSYVPPDLAAAGARAGLATGTQDGRIEWSLLDRDGRLVRGPVVLSQGVGGRDNRLPRIGWDGRLFVVAWETHPEGGAYAVAVDEQGVASPPVRVDAGEPHAGTVGVAVVGGRIVVAYTADRGRGMLATLACRASAARGAPPSIGRATPSAPSRR
jgi:hypothetical protein